MFVGPNRPIRHFAMYRSVLTRCSSFSLHRPFVLLIIVITSGRPFAHALFSPSFHPLHPSTFAFFLILRVVARFRSGQLHFFPGRGRNKTMIRIGIVVPHLPHIAALPQKDPSTPLPAEKGKIRRRDRHA